MIDSRSQGGIGWFLFTCCLLMLTVGCDRFEFRVGRMTPDGELVVFRLDNLTGQVCAFRAVSTSEVKVDKVLVSVDEELNPDYTYLPDFLATDVLDELVMEDCSGGIRAEGFMDRERTNRLKAELERKATRRELVETLLKEIDEFQDDQALVNTWE